jgi:hypothetical protein
VRIDEAWRNDAATGIDNLLRVGAERSDRRDRTLVDGDVAVECGAAGAVDDPPAFDDQIDISFPQNAAPRVADEFQCLRHCCA